MRRAQKDPSSFVLLNFNVPSQLDLTMTRSDKRIDFHRMRRIIHRGHQLYGEKLSFWIIL